VSLVDHWCQMLQRAVHPLSPGDSGAQVQTLQLGIFTNRL
jgi:hypothetical protein